MFHYQVPNSIKILLSYRSFLAALCCAGFVLAQTSAASSDSLTMDVTVNRVLQNSHLLKQIHSQIGALDARIKETEASFYPAVNFDASYANIGPDKILKITKFGPTPLAMAPANAIDAHIGASMLLYDFGKRSLAVKAADQAKQTIQSKLAGTSNGIVFFARQLLTNIARLQQNIIIQNENIEALNRQLDVVKKRVATGTSTEYDILKTEARISAAGSSLLDIQNSLAKQRIQLAIIMDIPSDSLKPIALAFDSVAIEVSPDTLLALALTQRSEIVDAKNVITSLNLQESLAEKDMMPTLSAGATTGFKNGYPDNVDLPMYNWVASIQVHVPIYNGKQMHHKTTGIRENIQAAQEQLIQAQDQVKSEVLQAYSDVQTSYAHLASSSVQMKVTQEALRLARGKFDAGTITINDELDSEHDYYQATMAHTLDKSLLTLSLFALDRAVGK